MADPLAAAQTTATAAIIAATISGMVTAGIGLLNVGTLRKIERQKIEHQKSRDAAERKLQTSRFSEPLARSAYDLQSRIYNILRGQLIETFVARGDARERSYVIDNTVYLIAQALCWTELVRREIQFIDLGENARTRELLRLQDGLYSIWGTDRFPPLLRLFAGEQRALGEALITSGAQSAECMGYGEFLKAFPKRANPLVDALRGDVAALAGGVAPAADRLTALHHALIDLLDMLDPDNVRFPAERRTKV